MKWTALFLLIFLLHSSAETNGQTSITLTEKNAPLEKVFADIQKISGYSIWYDKNILSSANAVDFHVVDASIEQVMDACCHDQPITYTIVGKMIAVKAKEKAIALSTATIDVSGKVIDEKDNPLAGTTITVRNKARSTVSADDGGFEIKDVGDNAALVVSHIGYETMEIPVGKQSFVTIRLHLSVSRLDEVQVIGYGTTTQRLSTGDVSKISADIISSQPVSDPLLAMEGRVSGVLITQSSGLPGSPVTVQIRGQNSIAASNSPLYIVDGVPFTSSPVEIAPGPNSVSSVGYGSPLNSINPVDIESIEVLKDADATAIYGSRGSNGVILITTKKGKIGKPGFNFNVNSGGGKLTRLAPTMDTRNYLMMRRQAFVEDSIAPSAANAPDLLTWDTTKYTNWQKFFFGGIDNQTQASGTFSGGDAHFRYAIRGTYHEEGSVYPTNDGYKRGSFHLSNEYNSLNQKFHINTQAFFVGDGNLISSSPSPLRTPAYLPPDYPGYDSLGNPYWGQGVYVQPVANLKRKYHSNTDNLNGNLVFKYNLFSDFTIKLNLGYNKIQINQVNTTPIEAQDPIFHPTGSMAYGNQNIKTYVLEPQLAYTKNLFCGKTEILVGSTVQHTTTTGLYLFANNYASDLLLGSFADGTIIQKTYSQQQYKYASLFGRLTYSWNEKYILNANLRQDASSRFGPSKSIGDFWSVGTAWLFYREQFIKEFLPILSYGKLRGSYGITGNDGIGDYGYIATYQGSDPYGSTNTLVPARIANPDYSWEVNRKMEIALELGFLKDRILLTSAWYRNRSGDQLVGYPLPTTTGFSSYQANLQALVQNRGIELELNALSVKAKYFSWNISANISFPENKLVSFPNISSTSYANSFVIGHSLHIVQGYRLIGVDPKTGLTQVQDINHDGIYTPLSSYNEQGGDFVIIGKTDPKWFGGLSNNFVWKQFKLDVFLQVVRQNGINLNYFYYLGHMQNAWQTDQGYWKNPGDRQALPKTSTSFGDSYNSQINFSESSAILSDASFLRLKNVMLLYNLNPEILRKLKLSAFSFFIQGQNLLTWTHFNGYDPETGNLSFSLPPLKMLVAGIQCSF
jgi:TonB-dependent starch-binding outer membrane protein SusC